MCVISAGFGLALAPAAAETACRGLDIDHVAYSVCQVDVRETALELFNLDSAGVPYGSIEALKKNLQAQGKELQFAMNAGMFDDHLKPIGLYVEDGAQAKKLNLRDGYGNFHLKPNGVFYITNGKIGIVTSEAYARLGLKPDFATQSGPMLVVDGQIHPKLSPTGSSLKIRNGVGMLNNHTAVFVLSRNPVTFYDFAKLFRDELKCQNALFLDGSVSSLYSRDLGQQGGFMPLGPIVGAYKMQ